MGRKRPRRVFVNSMSDLFHEDVPDAYITRVAQVMEMAGWHTFQVLTKRASRMRELLQTRLRFASEMKHIWWGVSVEDRAHGLPRVEHLRQAPAAVRFLSIEPLLEDLGPKSVPPWTPAIAKGIARDSEDFAFLSIGTGLGAGLVLRGELHRGHHGAAGDHVTDDTGTGFVHTAPGHGRDAQQVLCGLRHGGHDLNLRAALLHVLGPNPVATLDSAKLSLSASATIAQDTDVGLSGDYFLYKEDPTQVGYYSVGSAGRTHIAGGSGVAIAPLRFVVRPEVVQRFGDFSVGVWGEGGRYAVGAGQSTRGGGIKVQFRFTKAFRIWATGARQRDADAEGGISDTTSFALGAGYRF